MKTVFIGLLALASLELNQACKHNWLNDYKGPLNFTCPKGQIIGYLFSSYSMRDFDRIWEIECRQVPKTTDCEITDWKDDSKGPLRVFCPHPKLVTGIEGRIQVGRRAYRLTCCLVDGRSHDICNNQMFDRNKDIELKVNEGSGIQGYYDIIQPGNELLNLPTCPL